jgi:hypothetical protein
MSEVHALTVLLEKPTAGDKTVGLPELVNAILRWYVSLFPDRHVGGIPHETAGVLFDLFEQLGIEHVEEIAFLLVQRNPKLAMKLYHEIQYAELVERTKLNGRVPRDPQHMYAEFAPAVFTKRAYQCLIKNGITTRAKLMNLRVWNVNWIGAGNVFKREVQVAQKIIRAQSGVFDRRVDHDTEMKVGAAK